MHYNNVFFKDFTTSNAYVSFKLTIIYIYVKAELLSEMLKYWDI